MNNFLLLFATTLLLAAAACQKETDVNNDAAAEASENARIRAYLTDVYGFMPESIEETATDFIAERDQVFPKVNFWENYGVNNGSEFFAEAAYADGESDVHERRHYRSTYLVLPQYFYIHVNIKTNVPASWRTAIKEAVSKWNAMQGKYVFLVTEYSTTIYGSINIEMNSSLKVGTYANCEAPSAGGNPGSPMYINPYYNNIESKKKRATVMHEIGHAMGLRHTDWGLGTLITNVSTNCRTEPDPLSVMHNENWNYEFSTCDIQAFYALYPW